MLMMSLSTFMVWLFHLAIGLEKQYGVVQGDAATEGCEILTKSNTQRLSELSHTQQIPRKNAVGIKEKLTAIGQFAYFIFFMTADEKKVLIQRNEITAEKMLKDYQAMLKSADGSKADLVTEWRKNLAIYDANKTKLHTVKTNVIEFRFH
jgi:hypothetical protein